MTKRENPFGPGLLRFLGEIREHNTKAWFERHRERYEAEVREPALAFIRMMDGRLRKVSPHLRADDRKVGGSLTRIHRDVRFAKDKRPYKTNLGIQFRHEAGRDVHAPGLYVHVDADEMFLGAGMWRPEAAALRAVRNAIVDDPEGWRRVRDGKRFREAFDLAGESLKRVPRGFDAVHPYADDLRRTDHLAMCTLKTRDALRPDLVPFVAERFARARAYLAFQAEALDLAF
jgi:uncharacterized protein (TIGR02453 family)